MFSAVIPAQSPLRLAVIPAQSPLRLVVIPAQSPLRLAVIPAQSPLRLAVINHALLISSSATFGHVVTVMDRSRPAPLFFPADH